MPISVKNLSKSFESQQILRDFSIELPDEGIVCLFGASGSGKTTLLNLLLGVTKADSGTIDGLQGKKMSVVFQDDRLLPWITAKQNIEIVLDTAVNCGQRAQSWLQQVGLADAAAKKPGELSGGMRQRVSIARALAFEGDVLLLDEPFKGLDAAARGKMMALIAGKTKNKLVVLVTHSREEALMLSDSIYFLSGPPLAVQKKVEIPYHFEEKVQTPALMQEFEKYF